MRPTTPYKPGADLTCDEFHRDASYSNWRSHGTPDWLLIYTQAGGGRITLSGVSCETRAGDILLYAPHETQEYRTSPETRSWHLLWAHFVPQPHWLAWLGWPVDEKGFKFLRLADGELRADFQASMRRMIALSRRPIPIAHDLAVLALEEALLWAKLAAFADRWVTMDERVRRALNFLSSRFREPFSLEQLARHCGVSVSRLAHLFKEQTGSSPQRFLEQHRMQAASRLLRLTGFTVTEVAAEVGYDDPFYFSKRFRKYSGKSPQQFRA